MSDVIETRRLTLRPITLDDVDELVRLDSDPAVMRYISGGRPTPRSEVAATIEAALGHRWMAYAKAGGDFVGWFAVRPAPPHTSDRELGYRLLRRAWGQGYATEGSWVLVAHAFEQLGAGRVWAQTMTVNAASRRVMERCGLRYTRTVHLDWPERIEATELGDVEYELLEEDWTPE